MAKRPFISDNESTHLPHRLEILAFLAGAFPFVCRITNTSTTAINGINLLTATLNFTAIAGGLAVLWLTHKALKLWPRTIRKERIRRAALLAILFILGVIQLLRGVGLALLP